MLTSRTIYIIGFCALVCSQFIYAGAFQEGGEAYKKGDYVTAEKKFLEVAKKGDHRAMYALGSMYAGGTGVKKDYQKAYKWFSSAAKYGRIDAQYKLGLMYDEGAGIPRNYRRAARLYNKIAKKGYSPAQYRLGLLYASGHGVKQNNSKAYAWLLAAKQNLMKDLAGKKKDGDELTQKSGDIFTATPVELIVEELEKIKRKMESLQLEEARQLAQEYMQYR